MVDRFEEGMKVRRAVLGNEYVDKATSGSSEFDRPFQKYIAESAWGSVWAREHLSRRERSMITIALLAALGHEAELAIHVRASVNTGASAEDIREALLHVAVYAGVPAANRAFRVARAELERVADPEKGE